MRVRESDILCIDKGSLKKTSPYPGKRRAHQRECWAFSPLARGHHQRVHHQRSRREVVHHQCCAPREFLRHLDDAPPLGDGRPQDGFHRSCAARACRARPRCGHRDGHYQHTPALPPILVPTT